MIGDKLSSTSKCPDFFPDFSLTFLRAVVSYWRKYVHEVLVNCLGGLSLPRKSVVRLTDRPNMTLDVYRGRETTIQPITDILQFSIPFSCFTLLFSIANCITWKLGVTVKEKNLLEFAPWGSKFFPLTVVPN